MSCPACHSEGFVCLTEKEFQDILSDAEKAKWLLKALESVDDAVVFELLPRNTQEVVSDALDRARGH